MEHNSLTIFDTKSCISAKQMLKILTVVCIRVAPLIMPNFTHVSLLELTANLFSHRLLVHASIMQINQMWYCRSTLPFFLFFYYLKKNRARVCVWGQDGNTGLPLLPAGYVWGYCFRLWALLFNSLNQICHLLLQYLGRWEIKWSESVRSVANFN